ADRSEQPRRENVLVGELTERLFRASILALPGQLLHLFVRNQEPDAVALSIKAQPVFVIEVPLQADGGAGAGSLIGVVLLNGRIEIALGMERVEAGAGRRPAEHVLAGEIAALRGKAAA